MTLIDRISHVFKADAHGVVDSLEDRRLVLRQCLREAEAELDRKKARQAALADESRRLGEERERLRAACEKLDGDIELALDGGKEDIARFSARKLLESRSESERVEARLRQVEREGSELAECIGRQEAELASLKNRVRSAIERQKQGERTGESGAVAEAEVELELLRRRRERQGGE